tara:strand:+ start:376 stop:1593 length:1218 start_codon:yes stop_codon:yes gene_type:complete
MGLLKKYLLQNQLIINFKIFFMKNSLYLTFIFCTSLFITSCDKDDDHDHDHNHHQEVTAPDTYSFERNGESTVSFSGQTCRLQMAKDIYDALNSPNMYTAQQVLEMFNDGTGFDYSYDCGKNVGSKTAASSSASATVKPLFDNMINELFEDVAPNWTNTASVGMSGQITTSTGSTYQVNGMGLEIDQAFIKGLIGALVTDQITNNYLTASKLDGDGTTNNSEGLVAGQYTDMEHYWDEGFGYLYGYNNQHVGGFDDNTTDVAVGTGVLLNKYLKKVNDSNQPGIADVIYDAFKLGRAAIVAGDYVIRDAQSQIITEHLHKIIAYKAVDYLIGGAETIQSGAPREDTFHGLSEGYGFILSLQFTDYFSNSDVNNMLSQLMDGNGFWDISVDELNSMANTIANAAGI